MRYIVSFAALLLVAGCASQPTPPKPAPVAQAPTAQSKPVTLAEARRLGYRIVDEHGKTVYCRDQMETGSHVRKETICLTAEQLVEARDASKRNLDQLQRMTPPPSCNRTVPGAMGC
jgi:hypothetical protein